MVVEKTATFRRRERPPSYAKKGHHVGVRESLHGMQLRMGKPLNSLNA